MKRPGQESPKHKKKSFSVYRLGQGKCRQWLSRVHVCASFSLLTRAYTSSCVCVCVYTQAACYQVYDCSWESWIVSEDLENIPKADARVIATCTPLDVHARTRGMLSLSLSLSLSLTRTSQTYISNVLLTRTSHTCVCTRTRTSPRI